MKCLFAKAPNMTIKRKNYSSVCRYRVIVKQKMTVWGHRYNGWILVL